MQQSILGIHEFSIISAFVIGALFFATSLFLAILEALGKELSIRYMDDEAVASGEHGQDLEAPNVQLLQSDIRSFLPYDDGTARDVGQRENDDRDKYTPVVY